MAEKEDNEELKTFIKSDLEGMTKHFMQGFELLGSQLGGKSTPESSSSSPHVEKKTNGEAIFSKIRPHNQPHELKNHVKPPTGSLLTFIYNQKIHFLSKILFWAVKKIKCLHLQN